MSRKKLYSGVVILIFIVSFLYLFIKCNSSKPDVFNYLPQLRNYDLSDVKFRKIEADPSYITPYNILIAFKSAAQQIREELGLKEVQDVDTIALKSKTLLEEYALHFTMHSINATRSQSIDDAERGVTWWNVAGADSHYAAP